MQIARVVIDVASRAVDRPFDYAIPTGLEDLDVGSCVVVDFHGRTAVGYVVELPDDTDAVKLKPLIGVLGQPYFSHAAVEVAHWIASEYVAPLSESLRLFLPPGGAPRAVRHDTEQGVIWALQRPEAGELRTLWVSITGEGAAYAPQARAKAQRAVLEALAAGPLPLATVARVAASAREAVRALERAGVLEVSDRREFRALQAREYPAPRHVSLSAGQREALSRIDAAREHGGVVAIDGVTGSGKTEVYLRAMEQTLRAGKTSCLLVPEISLTPQTVGRLKARFGDLVAVLHSRLSAGERYDQWDLVRDGRARIVVGARSALFAPLCDLGLVIIDEEHESSYKQSSTPRYHARDVARRLAAAHNAVLVLGSASLSLETRELAASGRAQLVSMPERVTDHPLPSVEVIDMSREFSDGHRSMFARRTIDLLRATRGRGEKAVLFLNRRGSAAFMLCRDCGHVPTCDQCATSLTYHEVGSRLMCHHCGATRPVPAMCPECGSAYLRRFGAGTQRVESDLHALFPDWPIVRMDADTTAGKGAHERLLSQFEELPTGVLLGTQMIAKGLDYPEVTLVVIVAADSTLNVPDFRAAERTYQLLEQVAGRAGRGSAPGTVVVQTYWPEHAAVQAMAAHRPEEFYAQERASRAELGYPPYGRLANLLVWGRDQHEVCSHIERLATAIDEAIPPEWSLVGPSPAPIARLKGMWRWHLILKSPGDGAIGPTLAQAIAGCRAPAGVSRAIDVDAVDLA